MVRHEPCTTAEGMKTHSPKAADVRSSLETQSSKAPKPQSQRILAARLGKMKQPFVETAPSLFMA